MHVRIDTAGRRAAVLFAACAMTAGSVLVSAQAATASAKAKTEHFAIASADGHESVVMWGAITAGGRDDASHESYDVLHLGNGTLRVTHPDSQSTFTPHLNHKTCYFSYELKGKYTVGHGTGAYQGVTGHGTYDGAGHAILARKKSGACDQNAEPKVGIFTVNGSGPISK